MLLETVVAWIAFSVIAGIIAANKGRSPVAFFLLSIVLSPLIGIVAALVVRSDLVKSDEDRIARGFMRRCPQCAEAVLIDALKCKHCGSEIASTTTGQRFDDGEVKDLIARLQQGKQSGDSDVRALIDRLQKAKQA